MTTPPKLSRSGLSKSSIGPARDICGPRASTAGRRPPVADKAHTPAIDSTYVQSILPMARWWHLSSYRTVDPDQGIYVQLQKAIGPARRDQPTHAGPLPLWALSQMARAGCCRFMAEICALSDGSCSLRSGLMAKQRHLHLIG